MISTIELVFFASIHFSPGGLWCFPPKYYSTGVGRLFAQTKWSQLGEAVVRRTTVIQVQPSKRKEEITKPIFSTDRAQFKFRHLLLFLEEKQQVTHCSQYLQLCRITLTSKFVIGAFYYFWQITQQKPGVNYQLIRNRMKKT